MKIYLGNPMRKFFSYVFKKGNGIFMNVKVNPESR
jgi:hypothetical protein